MTHIVLYSGGLNSFMVAYLVLKKINGCACFT